MKKILKRTFAIIIGLIVLVVAVLALKLAVIDYAAGKYLKDDIATGDKSEKNRV